MSGLRRATAGDVAGIVRLHELAFGTRPIDRGNLGYVYRTTLFENPWRIDSVGPILAEDRGGEIVGFLGVIPRPYLVGDRSITAAVAFSYMTDPTRPDPFLAYQLVKEYFAGPQDLSISDGANRVTVDVWKRMGAELLPAHSVKWARIFRPCALALERRWQRARRDDPPPPLLGACRVIDAALCRLGPLRAPHTGLRERPARFDELASLLHAEPGGRRLRPVYDADSLRWLMVTAGLCDPRRSVIGRIVEDDGGMARGYYISLTGAGAIEEVLHLGGGSALRSVLESTCHHAHRRGAAALQIRPDPNHMEDFFDSGGFLKRSPAMIFHTADGEVREALLSGDCVLTPLGGEQWIRFPRARPAARARSARAGTER